MQGVMNSDDERRMTIVQHLEELRRVLIIAGGAWLACTAVSFAFNGFLLSLLLRPLKQILPQNNSLLSGAIYTAPTEGLTVPIKVASISGIILALPVILWQLWTFVSPGLRPAERKFAAPFIATAFLLFAAGAGFAYFIMPIGLNFLASFLSGNATYFPDISEYLSFFVFLILVFGAAFELPIAILLLGLLGVVSSRTLRRKRKFLWVGIIIGSLVVTPGADPFTPAMLAVPLIAFFEASVLILDKGFKR